MYLISYRKPTEADPKATEADPKAAEAEAHPKATEGLTPRQLRN